MSYKDYYKILGVNNSATNIEIEEAYQKLSARYSSEQFEEDELTETILNNIDEAYLVLTDTELRAEYDQQGTEWVLPESFYESTTDSDSLNDADTELPSEADRMATLFKSFIEKGLKEVARLSSQQKQHTYDKHTTVAYSIQDAFQGAIKTIKTQDTDLEIPIPVGAFSGQQLKLPGQGKPSPDGTIKGDLVITLIEKPHSYFFRKGNDLLYHASIDIYTALLGGKISVPTMDGRLSLTIPTGAINNTQIKVVGAGMPLFQEPNQRGDFYVELHVEMPKDLSDEEIELIKKLRGLRRK